MAKPDNDYDKFFTPEVENSLHELEQGLFEDMRNRGIGGVPTTWLDQHKNQTQEQGQAATPDTADQVDPIQQAQRDQQDADDRAARRDQAEQDRAEAAERGISVTDLRRERYEQQQEQPADLNDEQKRQAEELRKGIEDSIKEPRPKAEGEPEAVDQSASANSGEMVAVMKELAAAMKENTKELRAMTEELMSSMSGGRAPHDG